MAAGIFRPFRAVDICLVILGGLGEKTGYWNKNDGCDEKGPKI
jgi:hypothetical protein